MVICYSSNRKSTLDPFLQCGNDNPPSHVGSMVPSVERRQTSETALTNGMTLHVLLPPSKRLGLSRVTGRPPYDSQDLPPDG